jgi:hypothetical protein
MLALTSTGSQISTKNRQQSCCYATNQALAGSDGVRCKQPGSPGIACCDQGDQHGRGTGPGTAAHWEAQPPVVAQGAAANLRPRPLPQPTASSLVVESVFLIRVTRVIDDGAD